MDTVRAGCRHDAESPDVFASNRSTHYSSHPPSTSASFVEGIGKGDDNNEHNGGGGIGRVVDVAAVAVSAAASMAGTVT